MHRHAELRPLRRAHDVAASRSRAEAIADAELEQRLTHGVDQPPAEGSVLRARHDAGIEPDPDAVIGHNSDVQRGRQAGLVLGVHRRQPRRAPRHRSASAQRRQRHRIGIVLADRPFRGRLPTRKTLERRDLPAGRELDVPPQHLVEHLGPRRRLAVSAFGIPALQCNQQVDAHPGGRGIWDHCRACMGGVPQSIEPTWNRRRQELGIGQLIDAALGHYVERRQVIEAGVDVADGCQCMVVHSQIVDQWPGCQRCVRLSEAAINDVLKVQCVDADDHVGDRVGTAAFEQIDDFARGVFAEHDDFDACFFGEGLECVGRQVEVAMRQDTHRSGSAVGLAASSRDEDRRAGNGGKGADSPGEAPGEALIAAACHASESSGWCRCGPRGELRELRAHC